jgi:large subunit ribosomal protein L24
MQRVKKGDQVEVLAGADRGVRGEVNEIDEANRRVVVHGVHVVKKHQRRTGSVRTQTGIIEFEAPIDVSNVAPVCSSCDRWTRVAIEVLEDGRRVRVCKRCQAHLD